METLTIAGRGARSHLNACGFGVPGRFRLQPYKNIRVSMQRALRMPDNKTTFRSTCAAIA